MESLQIECSICLCEYDKDFHYPLVLPCGHDICSRSLEKFFQEGSVTCPMCKRDHEYENPEDIPKNFSLISVIKDHCQSYFLELENGLHHENIDEIETMIETIREENSTLNAFFDEITAIKKKVLSFNDQIIRSLEINAVILKKEQKEILSNNLKRIKISPHGQLEISGKV